MQHVFDTQFAQCNISRIFNMIYLRAAKQIKQNKNSIQKA